MYGVIIIIKKKKSNLKGNCIDFQLKLIWNYYVKKRSLQSVSVQNSFVREKRGKETAKRHRHLSMTSLVPPRRVNSRASLSQVLQFSESLSGARSLGVGH